MSRKIENLLVFAFTFAAFILGTTEYVIVGLLQDISTSLNVSLAASGILVSGFAIAYAMGTPFVVAWLGHIPRHMTIAAAYAAVLILTAVTSMAASFPVMLTLRISTAILCGLTLSLAIAMLSEFMSAARRAAAVAWVIGGFSIANVLGVPLGTLIGRATSWQASFLWTAIVGIIPLIIMMAIMPKSLTRSVVPVAQQLALFKNRRIVLAFMIPVLGVGSVFIIYTYITPFLEDVLGFPQQWTSSLLLVYGALTIFSNWLGAKVAQGNSRVKLKIIFLIQTALMAALALTVQLSWTALVLLMLVACFSYAISAAAQLYLIDLSDNAAPGSKDFAASLMPVASNLGIAGGSFLGSFVIDIVGVAYLPWAGALFAAGAFAVTARCYQLDQLEAKHSLQPDQSA